MGGADTWVDGLREYADPKLMIEALSKDPGGIAYTGLGYQTSQTKALALAGKSGGAYVLPTRETVALRTYPLSRPIYIYFSPDTPGGEPVAQVDPKIREFLRYILSRQGQEDVQHEGDYLPLTPAVAQVQLEILNQDRSTASARN